MRATARRRDHIREMLADLKLPRALEAVDEMLAAAEGVVLTPSVAIERLLVTLLNVCNFRPP